MLTAFPASDSIAGSNQREGVVMASRLIASASMAMLLVAPLPSLAQQEANGDQEEVKEVDTVVVTATRRSEPLKDVPLSVSVDRKSTRLNSSHVKISYAVF